MKRKFKFYAAVLFSFVMLFSFESCNKSQFSNNRNVSSATGWAINNKKGGFQYNTNYKGQQTLKKVYLLIHKMKMIQIMMNMIIRLVCFF